MLAKQTPTVEATEIVIGYLCAFAPHSDRNRIRCKSGSVMFKKKSPTSVDIIASNSSIAIEAPALAAATDAVADGDGVLIIGRGTRIVGEITDCRKVEIQGFVEGSVVADSLIIRTDGQVSGQISANHAVIHGEFSGQLKIENLLDVRATGKVEGDLAYGQLAVAMGGHILGRVTNPLNAEQVKPNLYASEAANIASLVADPRSRQPIQFQPQAQSSNGNPVR